MYKVPYDDYKSARLYPTSNFLLCITTVREEDGQLKEIDSQWINANGKEFRDSIFEDRKKGINRSIQIVDEKPTQFVFNQIYMLRTRKKVWIWVKEDKPDV